VTTTTTRVVAPLPTIKGETSSGSVEARLLTDPHVLWVGTWESADWRSLHGVGSFRSADHTATGSWGIGAAGRSLRAVAPGGETQGFGYHADLGRAGVGPQDDLYFRYRVYFPRNYVWRNGHGGGGGKLPGLAGKVAGDEEKVGSGGQRWNGDAEISRTQASSADGWSARLLWQKDGTLATYLYAVSPVGEPSERSWFGHVQTCRSTPNDGGSAKLTLRSGGWNDVELHVRMNTPGANNGVLQLWLGGHLCVDLRDVQYRSASRPSLRITQQFFTWYYGGPSSDAPDVTSTIYFDDAVLSRAYIGPRAG